VFSSFSSSLSSLLASINKNLDPASTDLFMCLSLRSCSVIQQAAANKTSHCPRCRTFVTQVHSFWYFSTSVTVLSKGVEAIVRGVFFDIQMTNYTAQRPFSEAVICSTTQGIFFILRNQNIHYRLHTSILLVSIQ
jgi:hypothetical protein